MNKKVLALIIALLAACMIVGSLVYADPWKPATTTFFKVHVPGASSQLVKRITDAYGNPTSELYEGVCAVGGYKINIGGTLEPYNPLYKTITGGTTFELDTDFNYEGEILTEINYDAYGSIATMTFTVFYNITFIPESPNHRIDGTLTFVSHSTIFYDTSPDTKTTMTYGFGSGDLAGVTVQASEGPYIHDDDLGYRFIGTQEGSITGFPINLIGK